jgi:hypothetical protein
MREQAHKKLNNQERRKMRERKSRASITGEKRQQE